MKDSKMIRRILSIVLCAIFVLLAGMTSVAAASDDSDTLTVGVPVDRCPLFYIDGKSDEITGIGVDLMKVAAEKAGYSVVFKAITEKTIKDALDNKEYDLIMPFGSPINSISGNRSIVSDNLLLSPFTLVTSGNRSLPPLSSLHVGMLRSQAGVAESVNQLYPHMQIDLYETMADSVKALRKGEVDGLLHNSYVWSYVLQKPSYKDLSMQPSAVFS
ncbi:MAG: transporter substrate-binding domain-containing protein, partial [Erysipelotrichaceae bacterium]|nr:transporter substrate-binding domain-containing protein [Erysipelotrichaceae bacterium]